MSILSKSIVLTAATAGFVTALLLLGPGKSLSAAAAPPQEPVPCAPSHTYTQTGSGTVCSTTRIDCGAHQTGECDPVSTFCEHTSLQGYANGCQPSLHGKNFGELGGPKTAITGIWGPFLVNVSDAKPACGTEVTRTVSFSDPNDETKTVGSVTDTFGCEEC